MMLIIVGSATYSYFAINNINIVNVANVNLEVINARSVFTSYSTDNLSLNVGLNNMITASSTASVIDTGDLIVHFSAPSDGQQMECSYDIIFVWDSTDQYTTASGTLASPYLYELSLTGTASAVGDSYSGYNYPAKGFTERNLTSFSWTGAAGTIGRQSTIVGNAKIYSNTVAGTTVTWTFNMNFYTRPEDQSAIAGKTYLAHLTTDNIDC